MLGSSFFFCCLRVIWCYKLGLLIGYFIKNRLRFPQILTVNISKFKARWAVGEEQALEHSGVRYLSSLQSHLILNLG